MAKGVSKYTTAKRRYSHEKGMVKNLFSKGFFSETSDIASVTGVFHSRQRIFVTRAGAFT
jgi:hypothetical protein